MPTIADLAAIVDGIKRTVGNSLRDTVNDPQGLLWMRLSQLAESLPARPEQRSIMPGVDQAGIGPNRPGLMEWGQNVAMQAPTMGLLGHTTWHGSPHSFDKFDASKIGTGEGAQAYGHGIYLAENPAVAKGYKEQLGAGRGNTDDDVIARAIQLSGGDLARAADDLAARAKHANIPGGKEKLLDMAKKVRSGYDPRGVLYKVDLPDEWLPKMLDWDKPLSEQPEAVRKAIGNLPAESRMARDPYGPRPDIDLFGKELYDKLQRASASNAGMIPEWAQVAKASPSAAEQLRALGIPGIRYLDQGSRGKEGGTYNYVVFPGMEGLLKILERQ